MNDKRIFQIQPKSPGTTWYKNSFEPTKIIIITKLILLWENTQCRSLTFLLSSHAPISRGHSTHCHYNN